jgi:hypothetical protein
MCRNIKTLFNFAPPATEEEIKAASLQYVRKVTGFNKPSKANEAAFYSAVEDIARITERLLASLETATPLRTGRKRRPRRRHARRFDSVGDHTDRRFYNQHTPMSVPALPRSK